MSKFCVSDNKQCVCVCVCVCVCACLARTRVLTELPGRASLPGGSRPLRGVHVVRPADAVLAIKLLELHQDLLLLGLRLRLTKFGQIRVTGSRTTTEGLAFTCKTFFESQRSSPTHPEPKQLTPTHTPRKELCFSRGGRGGGKPHLPPRITSRKRNAMMARNKKTATCCELNTGSLPSPGCSYLLHTMDLRDSAARVRTPGFTQPSIIALTKRSFGTSDVLRSDEDTKRSVM